MISPEAREVLLTGLPRSGTTLSCALLNRVAQTVALAEPMDVGALAGAGSKAAAMDLIAQFLDAQRTSLLADHLGYTRHEGGEVRDNFFSSQRDTDGLRQTRSDRGEIRFDKPLAPDFRLVVKHPAAFAALLPDLAHRFPCCALVRNPLSVLGSWNSGRIPVRDGRAPAAEAIDPDLAEALDGIAQRTDRQLHLLDWFFTKFQQGLPPDHIIRYETLIASQGAALRVVAPAAASLREPLASRNTSPLYDWDNMEELAHRLLASSGSYWQLYARQDVERVIEAARRAPR